MREPSREEFISGLYEAYGYQIVVGTCYLEYEEGTIHLGPEKILAGV